MPTAAWSQKITFAALAPDTAIHNQFSQYLEFLPYNGNITGVVVPSQWGNVASFTTCAGSIECEFFTPGAHIVFKNTHHVVEVEVGALPAQIAFQIGVRLTAFDTNGTVIATEQTGVATNGNIRRLAVKSKAQNIASVVLESLGAQVQGVFGLISLTFDAVSASQPDFILTGSGYVNALAGGFAIAAPLTIQRLGGSSGAINFVVSGAPAGMNAFVTPNVVPGDAATFGVLADASLLPKTYPVKVTAIPTSAQVGPSAHSVDVLVTVGPALTIVAPPSIDASSCNTSGPASGTIVVPITVFRAGPIAPPVTVSVGIAPSGVQVSLAPAQLQYPGNIVADSTTLTLQLTRGVDVSGSIDVTAHADVSPTNPAVATSRTIQLFGTCARQSASFLMRGSYICVNQGRPVPLAGAIVHVMRDDAFAFDPAVAETRTKPDGTFEAEVNASDTHTFYAKLFLNDREGVYLRRGYTLDVEEINSFNRGQNVGPIVDVGTTIIVRDGGTGTPACALWQGSRAAWQDYIAQTGFAPIIGDFGDYQDVVEYYVLDLAWTTRDTTRWNDGFSTVRNFNAPPSLPDLVNIPVGQQLELYGNNFHEFGHALRHTADGNDSEFWYDAARFTYGRLHSLCGGSNPGYIEIDGYAFNEGWAYFWSNMPVKKECGSSVDFKDLSVEGAVANDLQNLAAALGACAGIPASVQDVDLLHKRRSLLFDVFKGRAYRIHAESEFRTAFAETYPACTAPAVGRTEPPAGSDRFALSPVPQAFAQPQPAAKPRDNAGLRGIVRNADAELKSLRAERESVLRSQTAPTGSTRERAAAITRPFFIDARIAYVEMVKDRFVAMAAAPMPSGAYFTAEAEGGRRYDAEQFDTKARSIAADALRSAKAALEKADASGYAAEIAALARQERELDDSERYSGMAADRSVAGLLEVNRFWVRDKVQAEAGPDSRPWTRYVVPALLGLVLVVIAIALLRRRRSPA